METLRPITIVWAVLWLTLASACARDASTPVAEVPSDRPGPAALRPLGVEEAATTGWPVTGGDAGGPRYSPLADVHLGADDPTQEAAAL
jgi:hypothetical protein